MSDMQINSVLSQIRALRQQAEGAALRPDQASSPVAGGPQFVEMFKAGLDQVNSTQKTAADLGTKFELGDPNTDISDVMIAMQKSNIAFQGAVQVRNRLVSAYQEIMNMQV